MLREGFTEAEVDRYFAMSGQEVLTKTHGRKATGGLNHLTTYLSYFEKVLADGMFQPFITDTVAGRAVICYNMPVKSALLH
ncbi:MAG: hypothetical protein Q4E57_10045 [Eubacteriales bacterium]|nr:hypothetical protein [Eubacteriales bacterium]